MTLQETKDKLAAAGYVGEPTPELLRLVGWTPSDPLADVVLKTPVLTEASLKDQLALLVEEAQANSVPSQIIGAIKQIGGIAIGLAGMLPK